MSKPLNSLRKSVSAQMIENQLLGQRIGRLAGSCPAAPGALDRDRAAGLDPRGGAPRPSKSIPLAQRPVTYFEASEVEK